MPKRRHTPDQIINELREAEVLLSKGMKVPEVRRKIEVTEQTYYRWRKEYGGVRESSRWPHSSAATAIDGSQRCFDGRAGMLTTSESKGHAGKKA